MKIELIKKLNEKIPYCFKRPFAKFIRNRLIRNKIFVSTYDELTQFNNLTETEQKKIQLKKLRDTLEHAYKHTKLYRRIFDECGFNPEQLSKIEDIQVLPVLKKDFLKQHLDEIIADDIDNSYLVTTGGTTGEPTKVWMEKDAIYREWAFVYHYWAKFGYDYKSSKLATFRGVSLGERISEINPLYAEIRMNSFLLNEKNINVYLHRIDAYGADFIYGYPSVIYNFCRIAKLNGINLSKRFNAALLISENLYEFQEKTIKDVLDCEIAMFYGHSERAVFGEKIGSSYTFNKAYGVTELSINGEPVVTGFINQKTPLIRYVVDDEIQAVDENQYAIHGHRTAEVLLGKNGEQIAAASINFHDDSMSGIIAYQFEQSEKGKCILKVVSEKQDLCLDLDRIKERVQNKLGKVIECTVVQVDELVSTSRGKYRMIIQNIPSEIRGGIE